MEIYRRKRSFQAKGNSQWRGAESGVLRHQQGSQWLKGDNGRQEIEELGA